MRLFFLVLALLVSSAISASPASKCYTGYAYHTDDNSLAFTARYTPMGDGELDKWRVIYRDPANNVLARKNVDMSHNDFVPVYTEESTQSGYMKGIQRDENGNWQMVRREGANAEVETEAFEISSKMASDNGIHPFILAHFDALMAGEKIEFELPLAPRLSVMDMVIHRIDDSVIEGEPAAMFQVKLDMLFVGWFTRKIVFAYRPQSRELLAYRGLSTMQDERGKPYPVEVRYYRNRPAPAEPVLPACGSDLAHAG